MKSKVNKGQKGGKPGVSPQFKKKTVMPPLEESSDEEFSDAISDEEITGITKKALTGRKAQQTANGRKPNAGLAAAYDSDDDDDDDIEDMFEEDSDDESDVEDDDDDEEEDDDDDDEEEDDEDESEEEIKQEVPGSKKRKFSDVQQKQGKLSKKQRKEETPAKVNENKSKGSQAGDTLYMKNLPFKIENDDIKKHFPEAEEIRSLGKGVALARFQSAKKAAKILIAKQGIEIGGRNVNIQVAHAKLGQSAIVSPNKQSQFAHDDPTTLFIKNLPFDITDEKLRLDFPEALELRLPTKQNGTKKGFGYMKFADLKTAEKVLAERQGKKIGGRAIYLDKASNRPVQNKPPRKKKQIVQAGTTKVLFVKNLSYTTMPETLKAAFEGAESTRIMSRIDGSSRGFGYVRFGNPEDAQTAHDAMQDQMIEGRHILVDYAPEQPPTSSKKRVRSKGKSKDAKKSEAASPKATSPKTGEGKKLKAKAKKVEKKAAVKTEVETEVKAEVKTEVKAEVKDNAKGQKKQKKNKTRKGKKGAPKSPSNK